MRVITERRGKRQETSWKGMFTETGEKISSLILFYPQMASLLAEIIYHPKTGWPELVILTAKRAKIEGCKRYRYRQAEGYIHRLPECR